MNEIYVALGIVATLLIFYHSKRWWDYKEKVVTEGMLLAKHR